MCIRVPLKVLRMNYIGISFILKGVIVLGTSVTFIEYFEYNGASFVLIGLSVINLVCVGVLAREVGQRTQNLTSEESWRVIQCVK